MPIAPAALDALLATADRGAPALADGARSLSYGELIAAVDERAGAFADAGLPVRSVVLLRGGNSIDWLVTYLALTGRGHVPILAADDDATAAARLVERWSPAATLTAGSIELHDARPYDLHPDLALLMSTSGSTGDPKLVRLSADNLIANARSIAGFQRLDARDRGITTLPLRYSFGLSILHSHLSVGASVVVTDHSVVDPCFRQLLIDHGVTNVAGVPYTYELLDRVGPEQVRVPTLRFLAQAGGRMAPDRIVCWAAHARGWGAEWFTMYGQTEATARMAYLPPDAVAHHPDSIGIAIPGGELTVEGGTGDEPGEIVYRGPNVMLGYATHETDLAAGRTVDALRTGDLGVRDRDTGFIRIVGRSARHVKPFGLRIDLDDVERRLADAAIVADVAGDDELVVACTEASPDGVVAELASITGLPERMLAVVGAPAPRRPNGKIDHPKLLARARSTAGTAAPDVRAATPADAASLRTALLAEYAAVLGVDRVEPTDTFVSLGGDSLSYVECSVRIEQVLGTLPSDWHLRPIADLATTGRRRRLTWLDTTVVVRAVCILAVVSTHMRLWHVPGGAHLLLGVVGYNLARFVLPLDTPADRLRAGLRTVGRVAVPTMLWTLALMVLGQYTWTTLSLVNNYIGPASHAANHWHFWFIEVFVHLVALTTLTMAIPAVHRIDRRVPYLFPLALLAAVITLRFGWADMGDWYNLRFRTHAVAWFFVLGWLVYRSSTLPQRLLTTAICLASAPGVFANPRRELFIAGGLVLLVWVRRMPVPRPIVRPLATVAAASMWILISHFMIWPPMKQLFVVEVASPLTVLASVGVWWLAERAPRHVTRPFARPRLAIA